MNRPPLVNDAELQARTLQSDARQYSYDLVSKLTFFIISIELIFCGYILLNVENFDSARYLSVLFLLSGFAAICGLLWRFFYNQSTHDSAHGHRHGYTNVLNKLLTVSYWIYVSTTIIFLIFALVAGFKYIEGIEESRPVEVAVEQLSPSKLD